MAHRFKGLPEELLNMKATDLIDYEAWRQRPPQSPFFSSGRFLMENIDKICPVEPLPEGALPIYDHSSALPRMQPQADPAGELRDDGRVEGIS